jgi:heterodisulfide reductase subunit C
MRELESKTRVVVSKLDPKFKDEVASTPGGEHIKRCFLCGTCSAGCPVHELSDKYNPRKIIRMILLGMRDEVLSSDFVWLCSTCYTCRERCPQDVRMSDVMTAVRNIAVKEGHIHPSYLRQLELINTQGKLYEIDEFDNRRRERVGLPSLPTKNEQTGKLLNACGISKSPSEKSSVE